MARYLAGVSAMPVLLIQSIGSAHMAEELVERTLRGLFGCHLAQFGSINSRKCKVLIMMSRDPK